MFVTDVDGTLVGHRVGFDQYEAFRRYVGILRDRYGACWVICTGRSLRSFRHVFRPMMMLGIVPDYVISRHAYIYERKSRGWIPHGVWNLRVRWLQWRHEWKVRRAIPRMRRRMLGKNPFARVVLENHGRITFQFEDEGATRFGMEIVQSVAQSSRYLQVFQYPCEIDVRAIPFTKGLAVSELAHRIGVAPERVLVVGDGHNDISMMQPGVARYTACPRNGVPEVVEVVHQTGGHIAEGRSLTGVMEILDAHEAGQIKSELPAHWQPSRDVANPLALRQMPALSRRKIVMNVVLIAGTLYATMLALAYFGCMPFGRVIAMPFHWLVDLIGRLVHHMMGT